MKLRFELDTKAGSSDCITAKSEQNGTDNSMTKAKDYDNLVIRSIISITCSSASLLCQSPLSTNLDKINKN